MTFTEAISACFQKYTTFSGRSRRSEYWYFWLFNMLLSAFLSLIFGPESFIVGAISLITLLPGLAVCCRRLHDINKSGLWALIALVPIVGTILLLVWLCQDSDSGENFYGSCPK